MDRALYSIEETRARLGGISRNSVYAMLRAGDLPSVVIGCRRFVSADAIAALISNSTTSISPSLDAVRARRPLANAGQVLPSTARPISALVGPVPGEYWDRDNAAVEAITMSLLFATRVLSGRYWSDGRIANCPRSAATGVDAQ